MAQETIDVALDTDALIKLAVECFKKTGERKAFTKILKYANANGVRFFILPSVVTELENQKQKFINKGSYSKAIKFIKKYCVVVDVINDKFNQFHKELIELMKEYIKQGAISESEWTDAFNMAFATKMGLNFITDNCKHLVYNNNSQQIDKNQQRRDIIRKVNREKGYKEFFPLSFEEFANFILRNGEKITMNETDYVINDKNAPFKFTKGKVKTNYEICLS